MDQDAAYILTNESSPNADVSIWIIPECMRLSACSKPSETVTRLITVTSNASRSGVIRSTRFPARTNCVHAAIDALLAHGSQMIEDAYQSLTIAHQQWKFGRAGIRPYSSAAKSAMIQTAERVTSLAIDFAHAYQELKRLDTHQRHDSGIPDWLDCALVDLEQGNSKKKAAGTLMQSLTANR